MSGNRIFADTNIILYFLKGEQDVVDMIANKELVVSFVTELELLAFPKLSPEAEETIRSFLKNCSIIDLNQDIKDLTIAFRRKSKFKLPDAIVAATAHYSKLPLVTSDKQFRTLDELSIIFYEV